MLDCYIICQISCPLTEGNQRVRLIRRPTERDIFRDEITGQSLDPSCLLDPTYLPNFWKEEPCEQPEKQLLSREEKRIQREQAQVQSEQTGHWGLFEKNSSRRTERQLISKEDTQMWTEFAKDCQTGGIRGPSRIWDCHPATLQYEYNHWFPEIMVPSTGESAEMLNADKS